ncbi:MAG: hypothetical protein ACI9CU_002256 [Polaribacter sp.]
MITDVANEISNNEINVYPNPNEGAFILSVEDATSINEIKLVDALGRVILTESSQKNSYSFDGISSGLYTVIVSFENSTIQRKVVVN